MLKVKRSMTKMEGVLGAIDGLLVHIRLPRYTKNARPWLCYKSFYALNMQGVAGPDGECLYVNVGHAGATGDGCAARQSKFWDRCASNEFKYTDGNVFLGDAAYSLMPWLLTLYQGAQTIGGKNDVFNLHLSKGRQVIERAFGMMIKRWRILVSSLEFSVERCSMVIKICVMLHNMCMRDRLSQRVFIDQRTQRRHPFHPDSSENEIVPKIRLHVRR